MVGSVNQIKAAQAGRNGTDKTGLSPAGSPPMCSRWLLPSCCGRAGYTVSKRLQQSTVESRDIVGLAAGDQVAVDHGGLVDPLTAGIANVGLQAWPGGEPLAPHNASLDQRPRRVADGRDRLAGGDEVPDEGHSALVHSQPVGVGDPT